MEGMTDLCESVRQGRATKRAALYVSGLDQRQWALTAAPEGGWIAWTMGAMMQPLTD
jgi:hypothetical protein